MFQHGALGCPEAPDVHHMPRFGTMISGLIAAAEGQAESAFVSDL
jgi:hypothetical protein